MELSEDRFNHRAESMWMSAYYYMGYFIVVCFEMS
nr:MAG TPA: hypothetical protein [Bacteriophage sp.]DAF25732.1 MAG TPA: hypothetical protein [Caudoviricetes sp.]DAQ69172.1 MAG TPA: hypothetical protein [Caudoviricetes sp.]